MLERGFVPPIPDGMEGDEEDDLFSGTWRIGIPLMEWWLDLNRKYPHIPHPRADWVMASASRHGDTALLDWVLDAANNGVMTLELPESVLVDRGSVRPVSEWWRSSAAKGKVEWIPIFAWTSCIEDTVDDLEFFWALQFGPGTAAQPPPIVIYITFPSWLFAFDPQALEWIARTRAVGQEPIPQLHQSWTFQASWNAHRYDTLDALINHFTQRPPSHNQSLGHAIFYRVLDATGRGDLGLLEWWYAHPILRAAQVTATTTGLAQSNLEQALCHGDTDTATWWLNKTVVREGGDLSVSVPTLLDRVCRMKPALGVDYRPRALKWMVDNGLMAAAGSIAVDTLESLIRDRKGEYHQAAFLAWLASDGDPVAQEVLGAPRFGEKAEDAEVRVEWERIRRVARLSGV
ncbi:hypothetical protein BC828DRAFT_393840 [Blastocladiella britannica]|nr:hypothetical protein BC828DRAFT_393840 [Blastocladiella britannica]